MKTVLTIEDSGKKLEVELKMVDGKQFVEMELGKFLTLISKPSSESEPVAAAPKARKAPTPRKAKVAADAAEKPAKKATGAKRGRKPKVVEVPAETESPMDPLQ